MYIPLPHLAGSMQMTRELARCSNSNYIKMKNICFIPLRGGSKGIANKNVRIFKNKPLFSWCLDTVIESNIADEIWIATDCSLVKEIIKNEYPTVNVFNRSLENAQDTSPTIAVVLEFLLSKEYNHQDNFMLFQATSPLTSLTDILKLAEMIKRNHFESIVACLRMKRFRWTEEGESLDYELDYKPRRQDYNGFLVETGAFYMSKVGSIVNSQQLLSGKVGVIEIDGQAIIDIDEPIDWAVGEAYAKYLEETKCREIFTGSL